MKTIYSDVHLGHDVKMEMLATGPVPSYEQPARAEKVIAEIRTAAIGEVISPTAHGMEPLKRIHSEQYLAFLEDAWALWSARYGPEHQSLPYCFPNRAPGTPVPDHIDGQLGYYSFDLSAAITSGTWKAIVESADVALTGVDLLIAGEKAVFSLCRPPGHHAGRECMGGYCYLNNAAIAAQAFLDAGEKRIAILDVDYHHGNGTQDIFYDRSDVYYLSIHGHPDEEYPHYWGYAEEKGEGAGENYNLNVPLPLSGTDWQSYSAAIAQCAEEIKTFDPDVLIVSLGIDTYEKDPMADFELTTDDYLKMGKQLNQMGLSTLFVFEGGYHIEDLGRNTVNVIRGFDES